MLVLHAIDARGVLQDKGGDGPCLGVKCYDLAVGGVKCYDLAVGE